MSKSLASGAEWLVETVCFPQAHGTLSHIPLPPVIDQDLVLHFHGSPTGPGVVSFLFPLCDVHSRPTHSAILNPVLVALATPSEKISSLP